MEEPLLGHQVPKHSKWMVFTDFIICHACLRNCGLFLELLQCNYWSQFHLGNGAWLPYVQHAVSFGCCNQIENERRSILGSRA